MKNNYLVMNDSTDPYYNLALEEYLLTHYSEGMIVMLWQNDNTIVVGRHQNVLEEINEEYVREHGIKVARRATGGGAVYHDLGNLNYSFITDRDDTIDHGMRQFSGYVIEALKSIGADAWFSGRNDIVVSGKKVSGTAQRIYKDRVLNHGCLLYETDLSVVSKSLNVRAEKFQSKAVKSVRSRVGNIADFLCHPVSLEEFRQCLTETILKNQDCQSYVQLRLSESEQQEVKKLRDKKYATWQWIYGNPIKCSIHNCKKFEGGFLETYVDVKDGIICECRIFGDFMSLRPMEEITSQLTGCRYEYTSILRRFNEFCVSDYLGNIKAEEAVSVICY